MKNKNRIYRLLALAFAAILFLAACGGNDLAGDTDSSGDTDTDTPVAESDDKDTLIIGISNNVDSVNIFQRTGSQSTYVQRFFYETLLNMVGPTEFEPRLGSLETEDNQLFTVSLNPDATWSDGEPVTSADLVYSLNTTAHPDTLTSQATNISMIEGTDDSGKLPEGEESISGVEVIDDHTVQITTKNPLDINYISEFFGHNFMIAPEHVFGDIAPADIHTSEPATNPTVFNGAYTLVENKENDYVHLKANPDYYRGAPKIEDIYIRVVSSAALITELQSGAIDMVAGGGISVLSHNDIPILEEVDHLDIQGYPSVGVQYILPNFQKERFQDARVRRALAYAIDRELAVENLLLGDGEVPATPYTSASAYKSDDIEPIPYDPEEAKRLLEEANFDFSEPITFIVPTGNEVREQMSELVQQNLEAIGLNIQLETYDFTTWISVARDGDYDIGIIGSSHYQDPNLQNYYATGASSNLAHYSDERLDELIQAGNAATSFEERYPIYEEIQEFFVEEMPNIPLYGVYQYKVQDKSLNGGVPEFWSASLANVQDWHFED